MRRNLPIIPVLLSVVCGWPKAMAQTAAASGAQLLQAVETAFKAKDKPAVMPLYNWDGVPNWIKENQSDDIDDWLTRDLKSAALAPLPAGFSPSNEFDGIRFYLNVQPAGIIQLGFTDGFGCGIPYGKKDGAFYIASVIIEETKPAREDTNGLAIRVQWPDGRPVAHASVERGDSRKIPVLHFRKLYGEDIPAGANGRFHWPASDTNCFLVAANGRGFGFLRGAEITNQAVMVLHSWGRIEGRLANYNQALANVRLELTSDRGANLADGMDVRFSAENPVTDSEGRFVFEHVPPLKFVLKRHDSQTGLDIPVRSISVQPGETNHLEINGHGRTVIGRLTRGLELGMIDLDLASCHAWLAPAPDTSGAADKNIPVRVSSDGVIRGEFVEPGDYKISGSIQNKDQLLALIDSRVIHVRVDSSEPPGKAVEIGEVALKPAVNLKPGDAAPDFTVNDLDGKSLKLSDYRGKYVLLDFWATWCGPCVAETPNLQAVHEAFGSNDHFAMISLSLDHDASNPRKFARQRNIAWTQGFLGDWSEDKVSGAYGVYSIPAIFLIGPGQKVLAIDLRGKKIKDTVAAALAR
ncbi:MAG TPA: TlpA disulfide reductase family protein [Verrucomicrobiae bacterium]|jgi:peroxiredoxin